MKRKHRSVIESKGIIRLMKVLTSVWIHISIVQNKSITVKPTAYFGKMVKWYLYLSNELVLCTKYGRP